MYLYSQSVAVEGLLYNTMLEGGKEKGSCILEYIFHHSMYIQSNLPTRAQSNGLFPVYNVHYPKGLKKPFNPLITLKTGLNQSAMRISDSLPEPTAIHFTAKEANLTELVYIMDTLWKFEN